MQYFRPALNSSLYLILLAVVSFPAVSAFADGSAGGPVFAKNTDISPFYNPNEYEYRANYYYTLGDNLFQIRAYEDAAGLFEQALEFDPGHYKAHLARIEAYAKLGRDEDARISCEEMRTRFRTAGSGFCRRN